MAPIEPGIVRIDHRWLRVIPALVVVFFAANPVSRGGASAEPSVGPYVGPEAGTPASPAPPPHNQAYPTAAWNGENFLVVWSDERKWTGFDVWGARVRSDGAVIDRVGLPLSTQSASEYQPAVASDGSNFLVVWEDHRDGDTKSDIYATRVTAQGEALDPDGLRISDHPTNEKSPDIAWTGTHYVVVWMDARGGTTDVWGVRVTSDGEVLDPSAIQLTSAAEAQLLPKVASRGPTSLVVWQDGRSDDGTDVFGARLTSDGEVLDPEGIAIADTPSKKITPEIGWGRSSYLVTWEERDLEEIRAARVAPDGTVLDPESIVVGAGETVSWPAPVAAVGGRFLVAWSVNDEEPDDALLGARVDADGVVLDTDPIVLASEGQYEILPSMATDGRRFLVVWIDSLEISVTGYDVRGVFVSTSGQILPPSRFLISRSAAEQAPAELAWNGEVFLATWTEAQDAGAEIYASRIEADGTILDPEPLFVASVTYSFQLTGVASDGQDFLVVWMALLEDGADVLGLRVGADGAILDPEPIRISDRTGNQYNPEVVWGGESYLVLWQDTGLYAARVSRDGKVRDPSGIKVASWWGYPRFAAAASNGQTWMVVWATQRSATNHKFDVKGVRVDHDGHVVDRRRIVFGRDVQYPAGLDVASQGSAFLVTWVENRPDRDAVKARRANAGGLLLDARPFTISEGGWLLESSAGWSGATYLVAWQDRTNFPGNVVGARVTVDGAVLDPEGIVISATPESERAPNAVAGPRGSVAVAYLRLAPEHMYGSVERAFFRLVGGAN